MKKKDLVKQNFFNFYHPWYYHFSISLHSCRTTKNLLPGSTNVSRKIGFEERKAEDLLKILFLSLIQMRKSLHLPRCQMMGLLMARLLTKDTKIRIILPV